MTRKEANKPTEVQIAETKRRIKVMKAFINGKTIEVKSFSDKLGTWEVDTGPTWNWLHRDYRVAELEE